MRLTSSASLKEDAEQKPREKIMEQGVESLTDPELLSVVLRTGYGDLRVHELSRHLLAEFGTRGLLQFRTFSELSEATHLPPVKACTLLALGEYLRRLQRRDGTPIRSADQLYDYIRGDFGSTTFEQLRVICLDPQRRVLYSGLVAQGEPDRLSTTLTAVLYHPIRLNSRHFYLIHNHPDGLAEPSPEDIAFTISVQKEARKFGLSFDDHLIVGENGFYSFSLKGLL